MCSGGKGATTAPHGPSRTPHTPSRLHARPHAHMLRVHAQEHRTPCTRTIGPPHAKFSDGIARELSTPLSSVRSSDDRTSRRARAARPATSDRTHSRRRAAWLRVPPAWRDCARRTSPMQNWLHSQPAHPHHRAHVRHAEALGTPRATRPTVPVTFFLIPDMNPRHAHRLSRTPHSQHQRSPSSPLSTPSLSQSVSPRALQALKVQVALQRSKHVLSREGRKQLEHEV